MPRHVLSALVENHAGVLSRISGLFSRRGYSIDSLSVGSTEVLNVSRVTIVVDGDDETLYQIQNQLGKLIDVIKIEELKESTSVFRELVLIKIDAKQENRAEIIEVANIFRAHIIDVANQALIIEVTGDQGKINALINMLEPYGVKEVVRTGLCALQRGEVELKKI